MTHWREIAAGTGLAVLTTGIAWWLPDTQTHDLLALILVLIGSAYIGFALADGRPREIIIEFIGVGVFGACAVMGLWWSPWVLVVGYFGHGVWDIVHHPHGIKTDINDWYAPFCLTYDWLVGAYIVIWLISNPALAR